MDIMRSGIILIVYLFGITTLYLFLSSPFDDMVSNFENINQSASDTYVEETSSIVRIVFDMMFAGFAIVPIVWFIIEVFKREPDWRF